MTAALPIIATPGDPAGIGPEISLRAFLQGSRGWVLMGDRAHLASLAAALQLDIAFTDWQPGDKFDGDRFDGDKLAIWQHDWPAMPVPGQPDARNSAAIIQAIDRAVQLVTGGQAAAITTNPIHKASLYQAGFSHQGHTDYLASLTGGNPVMMLANSQMRVVPMTVHIPLAEVAKALTPALLEAVITTVRSALQQDFSVAQPHIAVCGLNPHAGEDGHLGREEIDIFQPVLDRLRAGGLQLTGPLPADGLFHAGSASRFDAIIGAYHDQALIPVKMADFYGSVNVTLGLPIIRTSPDHGTGFDIAGQGKARPDSLIAALTMAREMAARRPT
jgi:4-hydroxythreonine-4-phosphate dehydrogenase